ncbi:MAG TPA: ExeM/NucH family extracellular endonuclease [Gaiellaceae bacterium]|nr:ExeM/NucH family extracellular endonuclease [Gaiellaceae bacterium]
MSQLRMRLTIAVAAFVALTCVGNALAAGNVVVSQVYGGGGNTGAPYTHDYVELFNRSATTISLDGMSIQYGSATGTGNLGANSGQLTELSGSIGPGEYVLVQQAAGAGNGDPLPDADIVDPTPIAMAAGAGKVALVAGTESLGCNGGSAQCDAAALARIVDLVGYGNANFYEGAAAAPTLSNTTAALRKNGGATDTDDNSTDFTAAAPNPRTSSSPPPPPPPIEFGACGDGTETRIHVVQGTGTSTPVPGTKHVIEGVVVGDYQLSSQFNGFYLQEEDADVDANPASSEGIFVLGGSTDVEVGDVVRVSGTAGESFGLTQLGAVEQVQICPSSATVTPATLALPVPSTSTFEQVEGMRVVLQQTLTVTEVFTLGRFGELSLSAAGRLYIPTAVATPGAAAAAVATQNSLSRILLDDGDGRQNIDPTRYPFGGLSATSTLRVGDTLPSLTGVMDYRFNLYRIQPVGTIDFTPSNPRPAAPAPVGGNVKVASFNVLNYFNGDGQGGGFPTSRGANTPFELERQQAKIVSALTAIDADVVGLMEIENDAGATSALAQLVGALNAATAAGTYAAIDTGVIGTDEIKVALIYKPATVSPVGSWKILTSAVDPRFDTMRNRPALAQTFRHVGSAEKLTVVVNHLKSKGSGCGAGDDATDGSGNCDGTRTRAAAALVDWLAADPTASGDPDVMIIGDLNAYTFERPITTLEAGGYVNLIRLFNGLGAYSYVFNGESGYLDHALATSSLVDDVTGVTEWHINADEPIVLDYNVEFKTPNQVSTYYSPGPYRASDHDPVIVGLRFTASYAGICTLVRDVVSKEGIANALCAKLDAAAAAAARGNERAKEGHLGAFLNQVAAQRGKALTSAQASMLTSLAESL